MDDLPPGYSAYFRRGGPFALFTEWTIVDRQGGIFLVASGRSPMRMLAELNAQEAARTAASYASHVLRTQRQRGTEEER